MRRLPLAALAALALAAPPTASWRIIGPGGGGSMFHPTVSPHDSRTAVIACDMTGSYITHDGGDTWRNFNLGDPVQFFVFDPTDAGVIYAKAAGVFRSADGGDTWKRFFPREVQAITMGDDHAAPRLHTSARPSGNATALTVDPEDSRIVYVALDASLWVSYNTGENWENAGDLPATARQIWIDRTSPRGDRTLHVLGPAGVFVRQDGKWRTHAAPGPITHFAGTPPILYATIGGKLYVTSDGGVKWRESDLPGFGGEVSTLGASAQHPEIAYAAYSGARTPIRATSGVARTSDAGQHWEPVYGNVRDAWLAPTFGAGWAGLPYGIGVAPGDGNVAFATDSGRVVRTVDGGKVWTAQYAKQAADGNWTTNGIDVTTCYGVHFDPFDARHMFISYTDIGLWGSDNGGESWYSATRNGVPRQWVNTTYWVEFDPKVRGRMWAAMSGTHDLPRPKMWRRNSPDSFTGGVTRSDDGGRTWKVLNNGLPQTAVTHILRDPAGALYAAGFGRGVFKSTDGGDSWVLMNAGIEGPQPFAWRIVRDAKGELYLVVARRSDDGSFGNANDGALYRSVDGAEHWKRLPLPGGLNGPNGLAVDPRDPARLYLAAWGRSTREGAADGGIYLSMDHGATWRRVLAEDQHIYDVTIDPKNPRTLYAAGFESSAWKSVDRGLTWRRIAGFDFKWAHRVILHPQIRGKLYVTTFGGSVWETR